MVVRCDELECTVFAFDHGVNWKTTVMLENWYMYQTPDSKELIPRHSFGNTGNTKICLMGRYMFVCLCCCFTSQSGWLKV